MGQVMPRTKWVSSASSVPHVCLCSSPALTDPAMAGSRQQLAMGQASGQSYPDGARGHTLFLSALSVFPVIRDLASQAAEEAPVDLLSQNPGGSVRRTLGAFGLGRGHAPGFQWGECSLLPGQHVGDGSSRCSQPSPVCSTSSVS